MSAKLQGNWSVSGNIVQCAILCAEPFLTISFHIADQSQEAELNWQCPYIHQDQMT